MLEALADSDSFSLGYRHLGGLEPFEVKLTVDHGSSRLLIRGAHLFGEYPVWPEHAALVFQRFNKLAPLEDAASIPNHEITYLVSDGIDQIVGFARSGAEAAASTVILGGNYVAARRPHVQFQGLLNDVIWSHAMSRHTEQRIRRQVFKLNHEEGWFTKHGYFAGNANLPDFAPGHAES